MIFTNSEELFAYLTGVAVDTSKTVDIATYGMYVGITHAKDWHDVYPSAVRTFVDTLVARELRHRILVAVPFYKECLPGCLNCASEYNKLIERLVNTQATLKLNMRYVDNTSHLKYYRIGNLVVAGGINLTTGKSVDFATTVTGISARLRMNQQFNKLWRSSIADVERLRKT